MYKKIINDIQKVDEIHKECDLIFDYIIAEYKNYIEFGEVIGFDNFVKLMKLKTMLSSIKMNRAIYLRENTTDDLIDYTESVLEELKKCCMGYLKEFPRTYKEVRREESIYKLIG